MVQTEQLYLFPVERSKKPLRNTTTFVDNMKLPVHRWFRYSAGFSAEWAKSLIAETIAKNPYTKVLDPFAGSGTTLLAAQDMGVASYGVESHPFIARVAKAKLARRSDPEAYHDFALAVLEQGRSMTGDRSGSYGKLIHKCYSDDALRDLDRIRTAYEKAKDASAASELTWLTLLGILRKCSHVGTANWQYVLPNKKKRGARWPFDAFEEQIEIVYSDMRSSQEVPDTAAHLLESDARTCDGVASGFANLVITSPPYPNNYDYADATRLEMTFMGEIEGWSDLHSAVRRHLIVSCSQHVPEKAVDLHGILGTTELEAIREEIADVCKELAEVRLTKGGKKTYHLMVACYFRDIANVWKSLRRVCDSPSTVCFVIGDSAPYGVYVPVMDWMERLAMAAGFRTARFEKLRDRNTKWKNRKHRVPLVEGRLWVEG